MPMHKCNRVSVSPIKDTETFQKFYELIQEIVQDEVKEAISEYVPIVISDTAADADAAVATEENTNFVPNRRGSPWSPQETARLMGAFRQFVHDACRSHGRSYSAVISRIRRIINDHSNEELHKETL